MTEPTLVTVLVAQLATLIIALVKGAFGGGFGLVGIPILSMVMDPLSAGVVISPLFIPMDIVALRYFPPRTWSWPELKMLAPSMVIGIGIGALTLSLLDTRLVSILIAVVSLWFAGLYFSGGHKAAPIARSTWRALLAGLGSGMATMIAHSGSPPLYAYILRLGLAKEVLVGTVTIYFAVANAVKVWPWLYISPPTRGLLIVIAWCVPVAVLGVWIGWRLHTRLDQRRLYQGCYAILVVTAIKLLWDGIRGFL